MSAPSDRLGLALAGGGFRASLFHLGVLHRLAELDVLRHVQVLSTVSGGSIIGSIYALRLKRWIEERGARLARPDYVAIVREVDDILCRGIRRNLRTRLFLNPLTTMRVMLTPESMGTAMAGQYERHFLEDALLLAPGAELASVRDQDRRGLRRDLMERLRLDRLRIEPAGQDVERGLGAFNAHQQLSMAATPPDSAVAERDRPRPSVLTGITLNATTLNSGGRFSFSAVEVGDWYLGHFRHDERIELERRRWVRFEVDEEELRAAAAAGSGLTREEEDGASWTPTPRQVALALWWRTRGEGEGEGRYALAAQWGTLFLTAEESRRIRTAKELEFEYRFPGDLPDTDLGLLRQAKVAAWYLRYGLPEGKTGGREVSTHERRFRAMLKDIDGEVADSFEEYLGMDALPDLCEYVLELYLLRTAERVSPRFERDWDALTIADAVGASACFPPVFPPFVLGGIYDDAVVTRLGLTDGGAYDNTGVTALLDEGCTSVIASDTGGPFRITPASPAGHVGLVLRTPEILMRALGGVQRLGLRERRRLTRDLAQVASKLPDTGDPDDVRDALLQLRAHRELENLAYFKIDSPLPEPRDGTPGLRLGLDARRLAQLRTDLDGFGDIEIAALVNHGYDTADRFARRYLDRYRQPWWPQVAPQPPRGKIDAPEERIDAVIRAGSARFLRALKVGAPVTVGATAALLAALVVAGLLGFSLADLWQGAREVVARLATPLTTLVDRPGWLVGAIAAIPVLIPRYVAPWLVRRLSDPWTVPVLVAVGVGIVGLRYALRRWEPDRTVRAHKLAWARTAWKKASGYLGNLLWFVWALPLLLALASSALAGASWLLFFRPWQRATALEKPRPAEKPRPSGPGSGGSPSAESGESTSRREKAAAGGGGGDTHLP